MTNPTQPTEITISDVTCAVDARASLGEGPLWDPRANDGAGGLLWLDILGKKLHLLRPDSGAKQALDTREMIGCIGLAEPDANPYGAPYICAHANGFAWLKINGDEVELINISDPESDKPANRFNDGKVDQLGGFWAGTMDDKNGQPDGSWWRLDPADDARTPPINVDDGYICTNGPAFGVDGDVVYMTDSITRTIYRAQTNSREISDKQVFVEFGDTDYFPDGMEVDRFGYLWVAFWGKSCVQRYTPDGSEDLRVDVPVPQVTSLAFAGTSIFITTAAIGMSDAAIKAAPQSGSLFQCTTNIALAPEGMRIFGAG